MDRDRRRSARVHDQRQVPQGATTSSRRLPGTTSLNPAYKNMLQMADARTSGTAVTRIFSVLEVNGRDETKAFDVHEEAAAQRAALHQERRRRHAAGRPRAGRRRHLLHRRRARHQGQGLRRRRSAFPKEGIGTAAEGIALIKGAKNPELGKKLIDWATSPAMQNLFAKYKINFVPAHPDGAGRAEPRCGAQGREDLSRSMPPTPAPTASASSTAGSPRC